MKIVAQRLGHAKTDITNDIYAHALPSMQKDAAAKMASLLRRQILETGSSIGRVGRTGRFCRRRLGYEPEVNRMNGLRMRLLAFLVIGAIDASVGSAAERYRADCIARAASRRAPWFASNHPP